jgi:hypothetical protein
MPWGEEHELGTTPAAPERMAADQLAIVVDTFLEHRSTGNEERMRIALNSYRQARVMTKSRVS